MKDRRSEWRGDPLLHRSRRSRSPMMSFKRQQRPPMRAHRPSGRRSASRERRQEHPLRRLDHGRELVHNHSPPPQHRYRSLSPPFSSRDDGFRFQHDYVLPDHPSFNPSWKYSPSIKDREFHSQIDGALPPSSLDIEEQGILRQNSTFIGEGSSRSLYSDHPIGSAVLNLERMRRSGGSFGMEIQEVDMHSYNDGRRDPYDDMDRRHIHSRGFSIPKLPSSQLRPFSNISSSGILKEEVNSLHHNPISDGLATGVGRYPDDHLEHYTYNQVPKSDPLRHGLLDGSRIYEHDELGPIGLDDHRHRVQDELYKKMPGASRTELTNATSSTQFELDYPGDWRDQDDSTNRNLIQRTFSERRHYLQRDFAHDFDDVRAQQELPTNSGNWHDGLRIKSSRDYERMPFEEGFASEKHFFPISHRVEHRNRKPLLSDHEVDEHRLSMSAHDRSHMDDLGDYDVERMENRNYDIIEDIDDIDSRTVFMNDRHSFAPYVNEEMWPSEEMAGPSMSKSMLMEQSRYRKFLRGISSSDAFMPSKVVSSTPAEIGRNIDSKRRLKHPRSDFDTSSFSERRQDSLRPYKYWKRGMQDRLGAQARGKHDSDSLVVKNDPPEDSEEFKQQVHKAFLRYSKLLNESQHNQRIYQNQGNTYSLLCSVCGSTSKEFLDTNGLVTHCYHSHKPGLKTEHLGFHKALCVLLGWNWRVPPENSRAYQAMPVADAKAMREDLILWPPLVIIHNILVGDYSSTKVGKVVNVDSLEKILREMGFGAGKIRFCHGRPANQSIFTVKFLPTFSGLQTAERLHKHLADKKHGKQEFLQISSRGKNSEVESQSKRPDEFLYGYIAVAEDLYKLDPETKRRSLLKSRKDDIEAIADAPLNTI
ncbi:uncharacterized protein LOC110105814 [Dendrobium catenatum]|nr:uncharacterized protein LOC110105814 [Dendrobium catenatum]